MTAATALDPSRKPPLLLDTHALVWSVEDNARLGVQAKQEINRAAREERVMVSAITPWEIALLVSKSRLKLSRDVMQWLRDALSKPGVNLIGLEPEIAVESTRLPFEMHGDPADRILVATARHMGATLVTADGALLEISGKGHFRTLNATA
ncbi:MAG: type II toxin-antitoxin system VapC family toxin [Terracidiphilus sp.]